MTEEVLRPARCSNHTSECDWRRIDSSICSNLEAVRYLLTTGRQVTVFPSSIERPQTYCRMLRWGLRASANQKCCLYSTETGTNIKLKTLQYMTESTGIRILQTCQNDQSSTSMSAHLISLHKSLDITMPDLCRILVK